MHLLLALACEALVVMFWLLELEYMATGSTIYPCALNTYAPATVELKPMSANTVGLVGWIE